MGQRYRFVGEGAGVPGLPHEITDEEARALGVQDLLMDALKAGTYQEIAGAPAPRSRPSRAPAGPAGEGD